MSTNQNIKIHPSWKHQLQTEFDKAYFTTLTDSVKQEYLTKAVFPEPKNIFRAFDIVPFENVKVVILGQDPYHTPNVADGLAFSTKSGNRVPPSLQNIYKEIVTEFDFGPQNPYSHINNPDLTRLANQGVFLLNNTLTVRSGEANSHSKFGWGTFTDAVISVLSKNRKDLVFMLWGSFARKKKELILLPNSDIQNHLILESAHPSPLSAHNGFFGNNHFVKCNNWLKEKGLSEIVW